MAGDGGFGEVLSAKRVPRIRSLTRLMSSPSAAAVTMVRQSGEKEATSLPDDEDVATFGCGIVLSLLEIEVGRDFRGKTCSGFRLGSEFGAGSGSRTHEPHDVAAICQLGCLQTRPTVHRVHRGICTVRNVGTQMICDMCRCSFPHSYTRLAALRLGAVVPGCLRVSRWRTEKTHPSLGHTHPKSLTKTTTR